MLISLMSSKSPFSSFLINDNDLNCRENIRIDSKKIGKFKNLKKDDSPSYFALNLKIVK